MTDLTLRSRLAPFASLMAVAVACLGGPTPARAQEDPRDDFHGRGAPEIVVTATGLRQLDVLAGTSVVEGDTLLRNMNGQIGDVLARLPGVSATSFSPGASAPVLRGFQGARVAVLNDGLGAIDASGASADHAVAIDPLTAQRIEVLRGPAVLLYGSQAIGGAVNVIGTRIPTKVPREPVHIDALASLDTASSLREGGASVDLPAGENIAVHFDGSWRKTGDMEVGGYVLSPSLRAELLSQAGTDPANADRIASIANRRGKLGNSATRTWSLGSGVTLFSGDSSLGFSAGYYDTHYGVPARPGAADLAGEAVPVAIDLKAFRADMRGVLSLGEGPFSELRVRAGYTDYQHVEMEGAERGTSFYVNGGEGRVELVQRPRGDWRGSIGVQYLLKDFKAVGDEAVTPPYRTENVALFTMQEFPLGPFEAELGGRFEHSVVNSDTITASRSFNTFSGAFGLAYETDNGLRLGINLSRAERAPDGQELFASGAHVATQQFEIGDPSLRKEKAWGLEAFLRGKVGRANISFSAYRMWFSDYITLENRGDEQDGLPVYRVMQANARYSGLEGELKMPLFESEALRIDGELQGDYVRAELTGGTPLPRIPPLSFSAALEAKLRKVDVRGEVQWSASQSRLAPFETRTGSFTLVNASVAWHPLEGDRNVTILAQAENLLDVVGRRHASFTKDFVPMEGRNFKLSAKLSF